MKSLISATIVVLLVLHSLENVASVNGMLDSFTKLVKIIFAIRTLVCFGLVLFSSRFILILFILFLLSSFIGFLLFNKCMLAFNKDLLHFVPRMEGRFRQSGVSCLSYF